MERLTLRRAAATLTAAFLLVLPVLAQAAGHGEAEGHGAAAHEAHHGFAWLDWFLSSINFAILIAFLNWKVAPSLIAYFKTRSEALRREVEEAAAAKREAEAKKKEYETKILEIETNRESELARYRAEAELERERILADARASVDRLLREAESQLDRRLQAATHGIRAEIARQVADGTRKLIATDLGETEQLKLVDASLARFAARTLETTR